MPLFLAILVLLAPAVARSEHSGGKKASDTVAAAPEAKRACRNALDLLQHRCTRPPSTRVNDEATLAATLERLELCDKIDEPELAALLPAAAWERKRAKGELPRPDESALFRRMVGIVRQELLLTESGKIPARVATMVRDTEKKLAGAALRYATRTIADAIDGTAPADPKTVLETFASLPVFDPAPPFPLQNICAPMAERNAAYATDPRFAAWELMIALSFLDTKRPGATPSRTALGLATLLAERDPTHLRIISLRTLLRPVVAHEIERVDGKAALANGDPSTQTRLTDALASHLMPASARLLPATSHFDRIRVSPRLRADGSFDVWLPTTCPAGDTSKAKFGYVAQKDIGKYPVVLTTFEGGKEPELKAGLFGAATAVRVHLPEKERNSSRMLRRYALEATCQGVKHRFTIEVPLRWDKMADIAKRLAPAKTPEYTAFDADGVRRGLVVIGPELRKPRTLMKHLDANGFTCTKSIVKDLPAELRAQLGEGGKKKLDYFVADLANYAADTEMQMPSTGVRYVCTRPAGKDEKASQEIILLGELHPDDLERGETMPAMERQLFTMDELHDALTTSKRGDRLLFIDVSPNAEARARDAIGANPEQLLPIPISGSPIRSAGAVANPAEDVVTGWLHSLSEGHSYEQMHKEPGPLRTQFRVLPDEEGHRDQLVTSLGHRMNRGLLTAQINIIDIDDTAAARAVLLTGHLPPGGVRLETLRTVIDEALEKIAPKIPAAVRARLRELRTTANAALDRAHTGWPERRVDALNIATSFHVPYAPPWVTDWISTAYQNDLLQRLAPDSIFANLGASSPAGLAAREGGPRFHPALVAKLFAPDNSHYHQHRSSAMLPTAVAEELQWQVAEAYLSGMHVPSFGKVVTSEAIRAEVETRLAERLEGDDQNAQYQAMHLLFSLGKVTEGTARKMARALETGAVPWKVIRNSLDRSTGSFEPLEPFQAVFAKALESPTALNFEEAVQAAGVLNFDSARTVARLTKMIEVAQKKGGELDLPGESLRALFLSLGAYAGQGNADAAKVLHQVAGTPVGGPRGGGFFAEIGLTHAHNIALDRKDVPTVERIQRLAGDFVATRKWLYSLTFARPEHTKSIANSLPNLRPHEGDTEVTFGALERVARAAPADSAVARSAVLTFVKNATSPELRNRGILSLGNFGDHADTEETLRKSFASPNSTERFAATVALIRLKGPADKAAMTEFRKIVLDPNNSFFRPPATAMALLGTGDGPTRERVLEVLFTKTKNANEEVRAEAIVAMGPAALPAIRAALTLDNPWMVRVAALSLMKSPALAASMRPQLTRLLRTTTDQSTFGYAASALLEMAPPGR